MSHGDHSEAKAMEEFLAPLRTLKGRCEGQLETITKQEADYQVLMRQYVDQNHALSLELRQRHLFRIEGEVDQMVARMENIRALLLVEVDHFREMALTTSAVPERYRTESRAIIDECTRLSNDCIDKVVAIQRAGQETVQTLQAI